MKSREFLTILYNIGGNMGNFLYGGKRPTSITYQGKDVQTLKYNGVTVWEKFVLEPVTKTFSWWSTSGSRTENYIAPVGATVMRVKYTNYRGKNVTYYIKINQQHKFILRYEGTVHGGNGSYYHVSSIMLCKSDDDYNSPVQAMKGDYGSTSSKMELSFSKEINEHNFSDDTSDHEHLDWTK